MTISIDKALIQSLQYQYIRASEKATERRTVAASWLYCSRGLRRGADPAYEKGAADLKEANRILADVFKLRQENSNSSWERRALHLAHCFAKSRTYNECEPHSS